MPDAGITYYINSADGKERYEDAFFQEFIPSIEKTYRIRTNREFRGNILDSRVIVGGKGRRNEKNADEFALLALDVNGEARNITPQFTLHFYKEQNPELYKKGLDMIGTGLAYPMIYNDEVNIPSVRNAFKIPYDEAIHYLPFGCGEYILYHRSVGTPSGVINLLQALSVTLHKGINPVSNKAMGLSASQLGTFDTFNKLFSAYKKNVELYVE